MDAQYSLSVCAMVLRTARRAIEVRPWVIVLIQPNVQRSDLVRFRNRQDAQDHLRALRRFMPKTQFELVFDPPAQSQLD